MPFLDQENKELHLKIAFCGPRFAGKSTNLAHLYQLIPPQSRSDAISHEPNTRSFQFRATSKALPAGFWLRLHFYNLETPSFTPEFLQHRQADHTDGIILVMDNRPALSFYGDIDPLARLWRDALSVDAWRALAASLPFVLQLNKRDEPGARSVASLREQILLGPLADKPHVEAVARRGEGVLESLRAVISQILEQLKRSPAEFFLASPPEKISLEPPPPGRLRSVKPTHTFSLVGDPSLIAPLSEMGGVLESESRFLAFQAPSHPTNKNNRPSQGVYWCLRVGEAPSVKAWRHLLWARCLGAEQAVVWLDTREAKDPEAVDAFEVALREFLTQCRFLGDEAPVLRSDSAPEPGAGLVSRLDSLPLPTPWESQRALLFVQQRTPTLVARVLRGEASPGDTLSLMGSRGQESVRLTSLRVGLSEARSVAAGGVAALELEGATSAGVAGGLLLAAPGSVPVTGKLSLLVSCLFVTLEDQTPGTPLAFAPDAPPLSLAGLPAPLVEAPLAVVLVYGGVSFAATLLSDLAPLFEGREHLLRFSLKAALPLCPGLEVSFYRRVPPLLYGVATIA